MSKPVEPKAKRVVLTTDWGYEDFAVCSVCSAVVGDVALHMKYHSPSQPAVTNGWQAKRDEVRAKFGDAEATTSSTLKWYIFSITQAYATGDGLLSSRMKAFDTESDAWADAWERHCKPSASPSNDKVIS